MKTFNYEGWRGWFPPPIFQPKFWDFHLFWSKNLQIWLKSTFRSLKSVRRYQILKFWSVKWGRDMPTQQFIFKSFYFCTLFYEPIGTTRDLSLSDFEISGILAFASSAILEIQDVLGWGWRAPEHAAFGFFEVYKSRGLQLCVVVFLFACGGTLTERV